jgi:hypothetical protein
MTAEDLGKYLPPEGCKEKGFAGAKALSEALLDKKVKASECKGIPPRLPMPSTASFHWTSGFCDPMMNKVEEN